MKSPRLIFYSILSAIILLALSALFYHHAQSAKLVNSEQVIESSSATGNNNFTPTNQDSKNLASTAASLGKIITDTTTSSNRIVVAEKDGVQKMAIIPPTLANALTDDQILYSLFHTNAAPTKSGPGLNQHLTFYGITIDDQTNALAGATINGSILVVDGQNQPQQVPVQATSDGGGRFQFDMDFGQLITLTVSKGTNYIAPPQRWFKYGSAGYGPQESETISNPNINDPVVFVLTKKSQPNQLTEFRKYFFAPNNGDLVRVDLTTGQIVSSGGDLIISTTCLQPYSETTSSPWSLSLKVVDGGVFQVADQNTRMEYLLEAPADGYMDGIDVSYDQNSTPYRRQYEGWFYVRSRNGTIYAKMYFDMNTRWGERGVPFEIWAIVNPNGSPNLQNVSQ
jgi:hypothetical protein